MIKLNTRRMSETFARNTPSSCFYLLNLTNLSGLRIQLKLVDNKKFIKIYSNFPRLLFYFKYNLLPSITFYLSMLINSHDQKNPLMLVVNLKFIKNFINFLKLSLFKI